MEDHGGFLHPEVGIDKDLERLLAEDPGLYMEDILNQYSGSANNFNDCKVSTISPSPMLNKPSTIRRCVQQYYL